VANGASTFVSNCCSIIRIPTSNKTLFFFFSRLAAEKWFPHSHETLLILFINKYFFISTLPFLIVHLNNLLLLSPYYYYFYFISLEHVQMNAV
jgi:hypothetical protein